MAELETIATNLVTDPRLTAPLGSADGVEQQVRDSGNGLELRLQDTRLDGWVAPWANASLPQGDCIGVILLQSSTGLTPAGGSVITGEGASVIWMRGTVTSYARSITVRSSNLRLLRLHVPEGQKMLTILNVGAFSMDSWAKMQEHQILYFDGSGFYTAASDGYTLPPATNTTLGGVIIGEGLSVSDTGVIGVLRQEIPVATRDTLGGIKSGKGVSIAADGTMDVKLGGQNLRYDAQGRIEVFGVTAPDMSDYYTTAETNQILSNYYTKDLADATFERKDSSGGGGGGSGSGITQEQADQRYVKITDFTKYRLVTGSWSGPTLSGSTTFGSTQVSLPPGFTSPPVICIQCSNAQLNHVLQAIGTDTFTVAYHSINGGTQTANGVYIAIGPVANNS